jgi:hypothetical protein
MARLVRDEAREGDAMAALWFEERAETAVWHLVSGKSGTGRYRMACAWDLDLRDVRRVWPVKPGDDGPPIDERCHSCVDAEPRRGRL